MFAQYMLITVLIFAGLFFTIGTTASIIDKWDKVGESITTEIAAAFFAALLFTLAGVLFINVIITKLGPVG